MTGMTWRTVGASALALLFASSMAAAQAPLRVRGTIESVDGPNLSVKARDGAMMKVKLTDDAKVLTLDKKSL
ncbi:MAG TPA: hypothetical protein VN938_04245, partial [Xanthobacteraceae bacterium]|nr:hypothetical protein [Xanthobacteraceae bacterium]